MIFPSLLEIIAVVALVSAGIIIFTLISTLIGFLPAIIAAVVVYLLLGSFLYAAIAFVVVAFLWAIARKK